MSNHGRQLQPSEKDEPDYVLRGKTFKVYLYLLRHKQATGISEIQHALRFSSPSIALHHLEKLARLGVVSKDEFGRFNLEKKVDIGVLRGFANVGSVFIPRFAFYAGFFIVITLAYVILDLNSLSILALVGTAGAVSAFCYESWRVWRRRPF